MATRRPDKALTYLRRSSGPQEMSFICQLDWAIGESRKHNVRLDAQVEYLDYMKQNGLNSYRHIRLDDSITGANLQRPGFLALLQDIKCDRTISHLFIFQRDRLARPEEAVEMVLIEQGISQLGVTIILSDEVVPPCERGQSDLARSLVTLFKYTESGDFLKKHAERIIRSQRELARQGFRTGGNPPYGFARFLVDANGGRIEQLAPGRRVRQAGCHVRVFPVDEDKIAIWLHILELKSQGWGFKRIAQYLNVAGIPSPGAGQSRTDHGKRHTVTGKWSPNTVGELCRNRAILGIQEFGRRSEGTHRRLGDDGPRLLGDGDRHADGRLKIIFNSPELRVSVPTGAESRYDEAKWQDIQDEIERRGKSQRGIARSKDPARFPLSCRLVDLTEGCGAVFYPRTSGARKLYACGRYVRTAAAECHHNQIDAEAMLRFTLKSVKEMVERHGGRGQIARLLEACASQQGDKLETNPVADAMARQLEELRGQLATAERRMARENDDDRYEAIAAQRDQIKTELVAVERKLDEQSRRDSQKVGLSLEDQVEAALAVYDDIVRIANDDTARAEINGLLGRLNLRIGLNFIQGQKGKKRKVRRLLGGIIVMGDQALPVPLHGANSLDGGEAPIDVSAALPSPQNTGGSCVGPAFRTLPNIGESSATGPLLESPKEDISFQKDSRGDTI